MVVVAAAFESLSRAIVLSAKANLHGMATTTRLFKKNKREQDNNIQ
jgi:hypothetical protein